MVAVHTSSLENFLQLMGVLIIFVIVLILTYITTRWIASYQKGYGNNKNLEVVETLKITANKYIQIVRAGEEYLVLAIGKDEVRLLSKLTKEQLAEQPVQELPAVPGAENFREVLDRIRKHIPKK